SGTYIDVECSVSFGSGFLFNRLSSNNAIRMLGCESFAHKKWGLRLRDSATFLWAGGVAETNDYGAGYFESNVRGAVVDGVYDESNAQVGWTFTADNVNGAITPLTVKSNYLLNGYITDTTIGSV